MTNCWPFSRASDYADSERAPNGSSRCIGRRFGIIRESARYPLCRCRHKGYTFGQCYSLKTGRAYLGTVPSRKRVKRICETLSELTGRDQILLDQEIVVARLNRREPAGSRSLSSIKCWASSALLRGRVVSRGRYRETFSESRMRSFRTSGSTSGV